MKINKLVIVIFALSISFASCTSNEDDNLTQNPDTSIPEKDFIANIIASNNSQSTVEINFNPIENETIKSYEIKTELKTINATEMSSELNGAEDLYLGTNKIQVIATNITDQKIALDSITYNHKILKKNGGIIPRELVVEKNDAGNFRFLITASPFDYTQVKVEINNNFITNNKLGSIPKNLIKENESNNLKVSFSYDAKGQNKIIVNLRFRVRSEDL